MHLMGGSATLGAERAWARDAPPPLGTLGQLRLQAPDHRGDENKSPKMRPVTLERRDERVVVPRVLIDRVVVDEISAPVKNGPTAIEFDSPGDVRAVAEDDVRSGLAESGGGLDVLRRRTRPPVRPPMGGDDHEIARL